MALKGTGIKTDPYLIYTIQDLLDYSSICEAGNYGSKFASLQNNIDLNVSPYNTGEGFPRVYMSDTFYGNGYEISGAFINKPDTDNISFFYKKSTDTTISYIKNLKLTNVNITGNNNVSGMVVANTNCWVQCCYISGNITGNNYVSSFLTCDNALLLVTVNQGGILASISEANLMANDYCGGIGCLNLSTFNNISNSFNMNIFNGTLNCPNKADPIYGFLTSFPDITSTNNYYNLEKSDSYLDNSNYFTNSGISFDDIKFINLNEATTTSIVNFDNDTFSRIKIFIENFNRDHITHYYNDTDKYFILNLLLLVDGSYYTYKEDKFVLVTEDIDTLDLTNTQVDYIKNFNSINKNKLKEFLSDKTSIDIVYFGAKDNIDKPVVEYIKYEQNSKDNVNINQINDSLIKVGDYDDIINLNLLYTESNKKEIGDISLQQNIYSLSNNNTKPFTNLVDVLNNNLRMNYIEKQKVLKQQVSITYEVYKFYDKVRQLEVTLHSKDETRYLLSHNGGNTWYTYNNSNVWEVVPLASIYEKGLTKAQLANTTIMSTFPTSYASKIKFAVGISNEVPNSERIVKSLNIIYADNIGPSVSDYNIHIFDDYMNISADFNDIENDDISFKFLYKHTLDSDWSNLYPTDGNFITKSSGYQFSKDISILHMRTGENQIKLIVKDSKGILFESIKNIIIYSGSTNIQIDDYNDHSIQFTVGNDKNNDVKFKIYMNGKQISPVGNGYTEYFRVPHKVDFQWKSDQVVLNMPNTLTIEATDSYGNSSTVRHDFTGTYRGLLFKDITGSYYSTDTNDVLQILDFGSVIGGLEGDAVKIFIENKTGSRVKNVRIYTEDLEPDDKVNITLSKNNSPYTPVEEIIINSMETNEVDSFFARIDSNIEAKSTARKRFKIYAYCEIV